MFFERSLLSFTSTLTTILSLGYFSNIFSISSMLSSVSVGMMILKAKSRKNSNDSQFLTPPSNMTGKTVLTIFTSLILWPSDSIKSKSAIYISSAPLSFKPWAISTGDEDDAKTVFKGVYVSLFPDLPLTAWCCFKSITGIFLIMINN